MFLLIIVACGVHWNCHYALLCWNKDILEISLSQFIMSAPTDGEIKKRIAEVKRAFNEMKNFITNKNISLQIRKRGIQTFIWSINTYGSEAWTISNTMSKIIEAFEMWCWRRMQKIAWVVMVVKYWKNVGAKLLAGVIVSAIEEAVSAQHYALAEALAPIMGKTHRH